MLSTLSSSPTKHRTVWTLTILFFCKQWILLSNIWLWLSSIDERMPPERGAASEEDGLVTTWREWNCLMKAMAVSYSEVIICCVIESSIGIRGVSICYFFWVRLRYDAIGLMSINDLRRRLHCYEIASRITSSSSDINNFDQEFF